MIESPFGKYNHSQREKCEQLCKEPKRERCPILDGIMWILVVVLLTNVALDFFFPCT
jgi:hypothetical protein